LFDELVLALDKYVARSRKDLSIGGKDRNHTALCFLLPDIFHTALSIRCLIANGLLPSAEALLRSLVEKVGMLVYLCEDETSQRAALWLEGWKGTSPPSYSTLLHQLKRRVDRESPPIETDFILTLTELHVVVHPRIQGALRNLRPSSKLGHVVLDPGPHYKDPVYCEQISVKATIFVSLCLNEAEKVFKDS
jgi:hypothetical protein